MTEYYPIFAILLLWLAAWTDLTRRLIRNWISIALLLLFVLFAFFTAQPLDVAGHMLWAAGLFAVMFIGFCFGKVGGGDVKLATVTMLWAGPEMGPVFLVVTALTGGGLAIVMLLPQLRLLSEWAFAPITKHLASPEPADAASVPYGVAIATGGTAALYASYISGG
ncbi:prepilin peptidase [uncultured Sneathiella sp.]|uniref:A24 family peptidase n=1 Tax=uncultured Sneathiella sp. TaxID=879315 RepID=UPI0030EE850A|tara:strand:- start:14255 stop:14752 length:498 start_codon:yes stop_codon:yes gene_type:complete